MHYITQVGTSKIITPASKQKAMLQSHKISSVNNNNLISANGISFNYFFVVSRNVARTLN
jgi:hypothetical protein